MRRKRGRFNRYDDRDFSTFYELFASPKAPERTEPELGTRWRWEETKDGKVVKEYPWRMSRMDAQSDGFMCEGWIRAEVETYAVDIDRQNRSGHADTR